MIRLLQEGTYWLIETKGQTKILTFDGGQDFAWVVAENIGQILVTTYKQHPVDHYLAIGPYRIYDVEDEPELADMVHLELFVGGGKWQGYLLPTGLPDAQDRKNRIIPTREFVADRAKTRHSG